MVNNREAMDKGKKEAVISMFDSIAWRYDFLNHLLSFGFDRYWRRNAIKAISLIQKNPKNILDVATGTGDLAIAAMRLKPLKVTGVDISAKMLETGREKVRRKGFTEEIDLIECDIEKTSFRENIFDVVMVAFGVRNFSDPVRGLKEMYRVLRGDGTLMILEFSKPSGSLFKQVYDFYFMKILPVAGRIFSRNRSAYRYLPDSVMQFPDNESFIELLEKAGFTEIGQKKMTGGIVSIYTGIKPQVQ
ncbi:MAG: bifunctional demethylmenaquinone methyltransferase/2-methoxy-6-polyprenyl-1,4-benzoquinol methylase UbiE [Bacteroidales bacterium]|nr:bifunctional demethylmenaquinone methyltransferase/2-methoxy-6-polyprenyl-1,4-benzoquinol methylase UbiE [Bacteroidales bacterium]